MKESGSASSPARLGGRYHLVEPLGRGGMGVVVRATDLSLGRSVAIKVARIPDGPERDRLVREGLALAALRHPNLVEIYDVGRDGDLDYLVLEVIDGADLASRRPADPVGCLLQVAAGLEALHERGMLHRDLKPANIMITPRGDAKIVDLGLAWQAQWRGLTRTGFVVGTPSYMAPERRLGDPATPATDWYAWAACLYFALEGAAPFGPDSRTLRWEATTDPALRRLVEAGLSPVPTRRPCSLAEIQAELEAGGAGVAGVAHETTSAVTAALPRRFPTETRRPRSGDAPRLGPRSGPRRLPWRPLGALVLGVALAAIWARPRAPAPRAETTPPPGEVLETELGDALDAGLERRFRTQGFRAFRALPRALAVLRGEGPAPSSAQLETYDALLGEAGMPPLFDAFLVSRSATHEDARRALAQVLAFFEDLDAERAPLVDALEGERGRLARVGGALLPLQQLLMTLTSLPGHDEAFGRVMRPGQRALRKFLAEVLVVLDSPEAGALGPEVVSPAVLRHLLLMGLPDLLGAPPEVLVSRHPGGLSARRFFAAVVREQGLLLRSLALPPALPREGFLAAAAGLAPEDLEAQAAGARAVYAEAPTPTSPDTSAP